MTDQKSPEFRAPFFRSPGFKLLLIAALTIAMAVPLFFVQLVLTEREGRAQEAAQDIATGWGGSQIVAGPLLFVPYETNDQEIIDGRVVQSTSRHTAVILPSALDINANAQTQERWRGIFAVPVFRSGISLRAHFDKDALAHAAPPGAKVLWSEAYASVQIADVRGLAGNIQLDVNGTKQPFEPGMGSDVPTANGIHAPLGLAAMPDQLNLQAAIPLRGSRELSFAPLGKETSARVSSNWVSPSFFGDFLPGSRRIGKGGFDASWDVPYLARGMAQTFLSPNSAVQSLFGSTFGVKFYRPVDFYQLVERSLKYAMLFVGLAFIVFFVAELVAGRRLHGVQYTLIGAAQVLFYLLLLSLAEHIGFRVAYSLAAGATVLLTGLYASSAFAGILRATVLSVVLGGLYALLYVILIQEDYALLIGTGVLFAALGTTMFATRRIDWARVAVPSAG